MKLVKFCFEFQNDIKISKFAESYCISSAISVMNETLYWLYNVTIMLLMKETIMT